MKWFIQCLKKYAVFSGRSHRTEYWMFVLFSFVISFVLGFVTVMDMQFLGTLFTLATFIPSIAVCARRLHDINRSGWWMLIGLVPLIGWIVLLVWCVRKSDEGDNRFGPPLSYEIQ